jgi:hypothetical protein
MTEYEKLDKTIKRFWKSKGNADIFYLGRCADVSYALQKYLGAGDIYLVGGNGKNLAWHTVLKVGNSYFDIRGKQTADQVLRHNPIALSTKAIVKAGPEEIAHIKSLLNNDFVNETISGLKKAEKE